MAIRQEDCLDNSVIDLYCPHSLLDATVKFYTDELGFSLNTCSTSGVILQPQSSHAPSLRLRSTSQQLQATQTGLVFHIANFGIALSELTKAGCVVPGSQDANPGIFLIADPAGNQIEFRALPKS
jgi:catechol-2,3-dioxygenase